MKTDVISTKFINKITTFHRKQISKLKKEGEVKKRMQHQVSLDLILESKRNFTK